MYFYDTANPEQSLYHDFLFWIGAEYDTTVVFTDWTRSANFALDYAVRKIFQAMGDWKWDDANNSDLPIATTDIVSGQENYTIADEDLRINRVRFMDQNGNWHTLDPRTRREDKDHLLAKSGRPRTYFKQGRSIFPLPVPNYEMSGGIEIEFERGSNYFTVDDTTTAPGIPTPFHRYVSLLAANDFCIANVQLAPRLAPIQNAIAALDADLIEFMSHQDRDEKPKLKLRRSTEHY